MERVSAQAPSGESGDVGHSRDDHGVVYGVEVVVAHRERATLRVGDAFLKISADPTRTDREAEVMALAPIPTSKILWRNPPVLALAALTGSALGHLGHPSTASSAAWAAAGAAVRALHDAPLPPWPGRKLDELASHLTRECEWLVAHDVLPAEVVTRNRRLAETALRPWAPVFIHGDLQVDHVFVDGERSPASSTGPKEHPATRCSISPPSPSGTRNISATSSPVTARTSTESSFARGGRCDASAMSAGCSSTATARPITTPKSTCCDRHRKPAQPMLSATRIPQSQSARPTGASNRRLSDATT